MIHVDQQNGHSKEFFFSKPHFLSECGAAAFEFDKPAFHLKQITKLRTSEKIGVNLANHKPALLPACGQHAIVKKDFRACTFAKIDIARMVYNPARICILIIDPYLHLLTPVYWASYESPFLKVTILVPISAIFLSRFSSSSSMKRVYIVSVIFGFSCPSCLEI